MFLYSYNKLVILRVTAEQNNQTAINAMKYSKTF